LRKADLKKAAKLKEQATKFLKKGKLDKALEAYTELEKISKDDLRVPQKIAEILLREGRKEDAVKKYKESAEKYREKGFMVQAIAIYKVILDNAPDDEEAQDQIAKLRGESAKPSLAIKKKKKKKKEKIIKEPEPPAEEEPAEALPEEPEEEPEPEELAPPEEEEEIEELSEAAMPPAAWEGDLSEETVPLGGDEEPLAVEHADEEAELGVPMEMEDTGSLELEDEALEDVDATGAGDELGDFGEIGLEDEGSPEGVDIDPIDDEEELPPAGPEETPLFSDLESGEFQRVFELLNSRVAEKGQDIIRDGDDGDSIFIIARGKADVTKRSEAGEDVKVAVLGPSDFFGEIGYFYGKRTATVTAAAKCLLLEMAKADLDQVVEEFPRVKEVLQKFYRERVLENLLVDSPVFGVLSDKERDVFRDKFVLKELKPGDIVVKEGDPGDSLFLIKSGEVSVRTEHAVSGEPVELARLKGGDFFGEVSLIKNKPRTADVVAEEETEVLELLRDDFQDIAGSHPEIGSTLEETIEQRVEQTIKKMMESMEK
jgi:CRP-like cAMP-binding protein